MLGGLVTVANPKEAIKITALATHYKLPMIVDSGAWSNFTGKADISVEAHIEWLKANFKPGVRHVGLDVIGNAEASFANWKREVQAGLQVEPTIHFGTAPEFVDNYLKVGLRTDWINLGGMAHLQKKKNMLRTIASWSAAVMRRLPKGTKVHGLGATNPPLCDLVPFDAVDSTYWLQVHKFNTVPLFDESQCDWIRVPRSLRAKDWDHGKKQMLGRKGDFLKREYGYSATEIKDADMSLLTAITVEGQARFAKYFEKRHGKPIIVYMAGAGKNEFPMMERWNK